MFASDLPPPGIFDGCRFIQPIKLAVVGVAGGDSLGSSFPLGENNKEPVETGNRGTGTGDLNDFRRERLALFPGQKTQPGKGAQQASREALLPRGQGGRHQVGGEPERFVLTLDHTCGKQGQWFPVAPGNRDRPLVGGTAAADALVWAARKSPLAGAWVDYLTCRIGRVRPLADGWRAGSGRRDREGQSRAKPTSRRDSSHVNGGLQR